MIFSKSSLGAFPSSCGAASVHILESHPRLRIWVEAVPCEWFCFVALDSYFGTNAKNRWGGLPLVYAPRPPHPTRCLWAAPRHCHTVRWAVLSLWQVQSPLWACICFSPPCFCGCCSSYLDSLPSPLVACSFSRGELKDLFCFLYDSSWHSVASAGNGQAFLSLPCCCTVC